jgi:hypothetical protein
MENVMESEAKVTLLTEKKESHADLKVELPVKDVYTIFYAELF